MIENVQCFFICFAPFFQIILSVSTYTKVNETSNFEIVSTNEFVLDPVNARLSHVGPSASDAWRDNMSNAKRGDYCKYCCMFYDKMPVESRCLTDDHILCEFPVSYLFNEPNFPFNLPRFFL